METGPQFIVSIRRTGEARHRTGDPWIRRRVTQPLRHEGFYRRILILTDQ